MFHQQYFACFGVALCLVASMLLPHGVGATSLHDCMSKVMQTVDPNTTIAELQSQCETMIASGIVPTAPGEEPAVVKERIQVERKHILEPFTIMAHKPSYLLFAAYNGNGYDASTWQQYDQERDSWEKTEAQFQLSVKFPLLVNLWDNTFDIYASYTNRSFWQIYDSNSAPFRETNHEPEVWVQFHPDWEFLGFKNTWNSFGVNHQSNGQGGDLSRSWNRVFAWLTVERGNLAMSFKPWFRIPEDEADDDNPDITDYLGHYELSASYIRKEHVFSLMSRNNLESGFSRGAVQLSWSFPLGDWPYLKGYLQWFNGYGQSLIDYDRYVNSIGIGISLIDWL